MANSGWLVACRLGGGVVWYLNEPVSGKAKGDPAFVDQAIEVSDDSGGLQSVVKGSGPRGSVRRPATTALRDLFSCPVLS